MKEVIYKTGNLPDEQSTLEINQIGNGQSLKEFEDITTSKVSYISGTIARDEAELEAARSEKGKSPNEIKEITVFSPGILATPQTWTWRSSDVWRDNKIFGNNFSLGNQISC